MRKSSARRPVQASDSVQKVQPGPLKSPEHLKNFRRSLTNWFVKHGRSLPWRLTADPYLIWISEIMLQQTTVVAVVPYFERWRQRFPTVQSLASAEEHEVLRSWEGLGYYSRARNIHKTARRVVEHWNGEFPSQTDQLESLPGIGRYTAGAIRSFAFDLPAPIVEANTLRLYCRLLGFEGDPRSREGQNLLWQFARDLVPERKPGRFNQALMELGATVCAPSNPQCAACPVCSSCVAFQIGRQDQIPKLPARPPITPVTELAAVIEHQSQYLLYHRPEGERWAGLWDFPRIPWDRPATEAARQPGWIEQQLLQSLGVQVQVGRLLKEIKHSVTRFRITLRAFHAEYLDGRLTPGAIEFRWVTAQDLVHYPLSVTGRKLAQLLHSG